MLALLLAGADIVGLILSTVCGICVWDLCVGLVFVWLHVMVHSGVFFVVFCWQTSLSRFPSKSRVRVVEDILAGNLAPLPPASSARHGSGDGDDANDVVIPGIAFPDGTANPDAR